MKIQVKSNLLLLTSFFLIILVFGGFVYFFENTYSKDDFYKLLEAHIDTVLKGTINEKQKDGLIQGLESEFTNEKNFVFEYSGDTDFKFEVQVTKLPIDFFNNLVTNKQAEYFNNKIYFKGKIINLHNKNYIVVSSAENFLLQHQKRYLTKTLWVLVILASVLAVIISFFLMRFVFRPLTQITEKVKQINLENLHLRLEEKGESDELDELVNTFNNMLNRMETSFNTQNNFISNASHELRTPLTAIIGGADVALNKTRTIEEYVETLKVILEEAENLDKKTQALLFLAQTGFNGKTVKFDKVRMDQLLWDVKATTEKINPKSKIVMDMSRLPENHMKLKVKGNNQLLHLAVSNIIINACKYSKNDPVNVSLDSTDNHILLLIKDTGIGIPENEMDYIYDPFFRASNSKNFEGYGIGLPLTRNIIRMHGGELQVSSIQNVGTTVQIKLPVGQF
ncbi:sensor histidine kinase [Lacihabitans soyangensis]|uniref:histidine kinase n=1 Tax=Lacihabitans soyangensis TaxID=869394 RepID=A0AAE3H2T1_9BACT|nr:ATP-binding protein [Lacihabitans soyangensis]MCP9763858.1 HAMP domain-containing protein [Lacihabitans soyangensis]